MLWIGLTGGLGSGKSTVAKLLREKGFTVIDADEMARLAVRPDSIGLTKVLDQFGADLLLPDGQLDRKKLGQKVFGHPAALEKLEALIHPIVAQLTEERRREAELRGEAVAFYDVPLLFERKMENKFTSTVVVNCTLQKQIERTRKRDQLTEAEVLARLQHQIPLPEKAKRATFVIENEGSLADLKKNLEDWLNRLKSP